MASIAASRSMEDALDMMCGGGWEMCVCVCVVYVCTRVVCVCSVCISVRGNLDLGLKDSTPLVLFLHHLIDDVYDVAVRVDNVTTLCINKWRKSKKLMK